MDTLFVKVYSNNQTGDYFAVGFGQLFTTDWIHVESGGSSLWDSDWKEYAEMEYYKMLARALEHASSMYEVYSHHRVCIMQTRLHQLTLRTVVYKSSTQNGVKLEVFRDPSFDYVSGEWIGFHVSVGRIFPRSAYYFHVSIDITHRKETRRIATLHSTSMIARSLSVVSPTAAHTQRNNFILTNTDSLSVKVYSNNQTGHCFALGFGQFFGEDWIHVVSEESGTWDSTEYYAEQYAQE